MPTTESTDGTGPKPPALPTLSITQSGGFTHTFGRFILPKASRPPFSCLYAYFRWVDDVADSTTLTLVTKERFLEGQMRLVRDLFAGVEDATGAGEEGEVLLSNVVSFDRKRGSKLEECISGMLCCIMYDAKRIGTLPVQSELDHYIELEASSLLKGFLAFSHDDADLDNLQIPYDGIGAKWAHILRDFVQDVRLGIINISVEEVRSYGIERSELDRPWDSPHMADWVASKVALAQSYFERGKRNIYQNRSLRYKFVMGLVCARYESYLSTIRKDKFKLREEYRKDLRLVAATLGRALMNSAIALAVHLEQKLGLQRTKGAQTD